MFNLKYIQGNYESPKFLSNYLPNYLKSLPNYLLNYLLNWLLNFIFWMISKVKSPPIKVNVTTNWKPPSNGYKIDSKNNQFDLCLGKLWISLCFATKILVSFTPTKKDDSTILVRVPP